MKDVSVTPQEVRQAVEASGGWNGKLAGRYGLYRQLVEGWERSGQVPRVWRLVLKASLKPLQAPK